jgi:hypothetical protein
MYIEEMTRSHAFKIPQENDKIETYIKTRIHNFLVKHKYGNCEVNIDLLLCKKD